MQPSGIPCQPRPSGGYQVVNKWIDFMTFEASAADYYPSCCGNKDVWLYPSLLPNDILVRTNAGSHACVMNSTILVPEDKLRGAETTADGNS